MKTGRFIGALMVLISFFALITSGIIYLFFAKEKSNHWIIGIFFVIASAEAFGWFYVVAKESAKKRIHELFDKAKNFKGEIHVNGKEIKVKQMPGQKPEGV